MSKKYFAMLWGSQQFDKLDEEQATPLDFMEKGFNLLHKSVVLFAPFSLIYCSWLQSTKASSSSRRSMGWKF